MGKVALIFIQSWKEKSIHAFRKGISVLQNLYNLEIKLDTSISLRRQPLHIYISQ